MGITMLNFYSASLVIVAGLIFAQDQFSNNEQLSLEYNSNLAPNSSKVFLCNFEGADSCGFTPTYNQSKRSLSWAIHQGNETYIKAFDHTLKSEQGHFLGMDLHRTDAKGLTSTSNYAIISEYFPPTPQSCVTFFYYMTRLSNNETLSFHLANSTRFPLHGKRLWSVSGDLGEIWYSHRITVSSYLKWKIMFAIQTRLSDHGLIAIDDVKIELDKPCDAEPTPSPSPITTNLPSSNLSCDFEEGTFCNWKNEQDGISVWAILYPPKYPEPIGPIKDLWPRSDHTLKNSSGIYAYIFADDQGAYGTRNATLVETDYQVNGSGVTTCLTLWYFMRTRGEVELNVSVRAQNETTKNFIMVKGDHGDKWNLLKLETQGVEYGYVFDISAKAKMGIVAIDDISIQHNSCD